MGTKAYGLESHFGEFEQWLIMLIILCKKHWYGSPDIDC